MADLSYKEKVARSFSRAAKSYDTFAGLQRDVAIETVALVEHAPERILDIGCGTGNVTRELARLYPKADIFAADLSHAMVETTRNNAGDCKGFVAADFEGIPFQEGTFNTIISSLAYQWTKDLTKAMAEAYRVLTPGGSFIFSTLGPETFKELRAVRTELHKTSGRDGLAPSMNFSSSEVLSKAIKTVGFEIKLMRSEEVRREYRNLFALLKALKGIGAINPEQAKEKSLGQATILKDLSRNYTERFSTEDNGSIYATYDVLYFTLIKP